MMALLAGVGLAMAAIPAGATIFFDWKCDVLTTEGTCAAEPGLNLTFGFKDSVVVGGASFVGADTGLDSLSFTSSEGDGFTVTLSDWVIDRANLKVTFSDDAMVVKGLEDVGADTLLFVGGFSPAPGLIRFREGNGELDLSGNIRTYAINRRQDNSPSFSFALGEIAGVFVRRSEDVPEPPALPLFGVALTGLLLIRRWRVAAVSGVVSR